MVKSIEKPTFAVHKKIKLAISILTLGMLFLSCKKEEEATSDQVVTYEDYKTLELNANIKSIKITTKKNQQDQVEKAALKTYRIEQYFFSDNGQLTQKKVFLENGNMLEEHFYEGKDQLVKSIKYLNGKVFETITTERNSNGELYQIKKLDAENHPKEIERYAYQNGLLSQKTKLDGNQNEKEKITFEYSSKQLLETEKHYQKSKLILTKKYDYNEFDLLAQEFDFNAKNELILTTKYLYNDTNELVSTAYYNSKNALVRSEKKKFDEFNQLVSYNVLDETGQNIATEMKYNDKNQLIGYEQFENEVLTESLTHTYNLAGFLTQTEDNLNRNSSFTMIYEYELDDKNNWIKKTTSSKNSILEAVTREIVYYE